MILSEKYYSELINNLDETIREKALIIADQLVSRENLNSEKAIRVGVALAKKYQEMKSKGLC